MSVYPVGGSGSQALQQAYKHMNDAASRIARDSTTAANPKTEATSSGNGTTQSLVEMKEASAQTQAGVKAVKAQDGMVGTLFDNYA
ncbi:hypothetical protein [Methylomagnum ishizawai]|uniref:hypothetical protein n=1 Tax=Methylomagnum ishizawai TaxID=1760988 RepID=UPI001C3359D3|nr:hypothetical protein [Methylomagnum ishizawai]BBL75775.1 hypothetical protein MishRS11D_28730 [Methylomagnum ishizawai]